MNTNHGTDTSGTTLHFAAGETIFSEGEAATLVYIVVDGEVELTLHGRPVGSESEGGIVGEMALINESVRAATARAKTDCTLDTIDHDGFLALIQQSPSFALHVMRVMADRLIRSNELLIKHD